MRKNITIVLALLTISFSFAQSKNKYGAVKNSKKLSTSFKTVKESDKDDYYQQYYWLTKAEELAQYPHLSKVKPAILYEFVKEINPATPTKKLDARQKELRADSEKALDYFISRKDLTNPNLKFNLESYVDPSGENYYTEVNPEKIQELMPKTLYTFSSVNKKTRKEKLYFVWLDDNKGYRIVNVIPGDDDEKFYNALRRVLPDYQFSTFVPEVVKEKKNVKGKEKIYYYVKPFEQSNNNIEYRTEDFKKFELTRYKKAGGEWTEVIKD